jgi:preprotein translocase subunit SecB
MNKAQQKRLNKLMAEAKNFKLRWIRLVESRSRLGQFPADQMPKHATQSIELNVNVKEDRTATQAITPFRLAITHEGSKDTEAAILIEATFAMEFEITKPSMTMALITEIMKSMAMIIIWPFWREFVQSTGARMALPPLPVPLINTASLVEETASKKPVKSNN